MSVKGCVSHPWHCRHCKAVIISGYDEIRELDPKPAAGSFAVCGECSPEPWWRKAAPATAAGATRRDEISRGGGYSQ